MPVDQRPAPSRGAASQRLAATTDGREVVVKAAGPGEPARRLAHEAEVLRRVRHPGVVEVVAERALDDGGLEVMVGLVSASTVGDLVGDTTVGPSGIAGLVVALATTVADLHDLGVAHTRLRAEHVLLDDGGRPVLCGFGDAVVATGDAPLPVAVRALDVAALGDLLRRLLTASDPGDGGWEPIPARRFGGRGAGPAGRGDRWHAYARRTLLNVADRATAEDVAHRPDARTFAADVLAALPEARLPGAAGPTDEAPLPSRVPRSSRSRWSGIVDRSGRSGRSVLEGVRAARRSASSLAGRVPWTPLAGALGLGLLLVGLSGVLAGPGGSGRAVDGAPAPLPVEAAPSPSAAAAPSTTVVPDPAPDPGPDPATGPSIGTAGAAPACGTVGGPAPGGPVADPDGDGCPAPVSVADGAVEVGGVRYAVGAPGDLLAVGDWDCDGAATVGLVQQASGRVYLFDRWAGPGEDVSAPAAAVVAAPAGAVEVVGRDGCDVLVVTGADGGRTEVVAGAAGDGAG